MEKNNPIYTPLVHPYGGRTAVPGGHSLVIPFFDLHEKLLEKGFYRFRVSGQCMLPAVWPGDLLHILSSRIDDIQINDIAVFRKGDQLFAHRIISSGRDPDGRPFVVTQGDASVQTDGAVFEDQLLGIVTKIERSGKFLPTTPIQTSTLALLRYHGFRFKVFLRRHFQKQLYPLYVVLALNGFNSIFLRYVRATSALLQSHVTVPHYHPLLGELSWKLAVSEFVSLVLEKKSEITEFSLHLTGLGRSIGSLRFGLATDQTAEWWLTGSQIAPDRYGILYLHELLEQSAVIFRALGIRDLYSAFGPDSRFDRYVFSRHGFTPLNKRHRQFVGDDGLSRPLAVYKKTIA